MPDPMVVVDEARVQAVAAALRVASEGLKQFDFTEPRGRYPAAGNPRALDYFFAATLHQYGFWREDAGRWIEPVWADVCGERLKGSDIISRGATRALERDPAIFSPARLAAWTRSDLTAAWGDDHGRMPLPMAETHLDLARGFGAAMLERRWTYVGIVSEANAAPRPVGRILDLLEALPGYAGDPYRKKSMLLAYILAGRPERWLRAAADDDWGPCIDYHVQRTALRMGLVDVRDSELRRALVERRFVGAESEAAIRAAVFDAMRRLREASGLSDAVLDAVFFESRRRCPETSEPDCPRCPADAGCGKRKDLFQPVFRTTFY